MVNPLAKKTIEKATGELNQALTGLGSIQQQDILQNLAMLLEMTNQKGATHFTRDDIVKALGHTLTSLFEGSRPGGRVTGGMLVATHLLREVGKIYEASADGKLTAHNPENLGIYAYLQERDKPRFNIEFTEDVKKNKFRFAKKDDGRLAKLVDIIKQRGFLSARQLRVLVDLLPDDKPKS